MGLTDRTGYLERVTLENQQVLPLGDVAADRAPYFSMLLIYKGAEGWVQHQPVPLQVLEGGE